jgi:hypothetical protein
MELNSGRLATLERACQILRTQRWSQDTAMVVGSQQLEDSK